MKIFRKIRFSILSKSNFGKYLIYAIGEIILVVIGILIALYLNNEKDISDRQEKQRNHLALIKEELEHNLIILREEDQTLLDIITNIRTVINLKNSNISAEEINETNLSSNLFLPLTRSIEIDYENGAFNDFVASSGLKDVQNDSIKTMLRSWERKLTTLKMQENVVKKSLDKAVNFIETNGSFKTVFDNINLSEDYLEVNNSPTNVSNKHIIQSQQFENILLQYLGVATQLHKGNYPDFKDDIELLISLIDNELKN